MSTVLMTEVNLSWPSFRLDKAFPIWSLLNLYTWSWVGERLFISRVKLLLDLTWSWVGECLFISWVKLLLDLYTWSWVGERLFVSQIKRLLELYWWFLTSKIYFQISLLGRKWFFNKFYFHLNHMKKIYG